MEAGRRYEILCSSLFLDATVHLWIALFATAIGGTGSSVDELQYKTTSQKLDILHGLVSAFPELAWLEVVGNLNGTTVRSLIVSKHTRRRAFLTTRVRLASDFPAGSEILIHFASFLLQEYGKNSKVTQLLNATEVHFLFWLYDYQVQPLRGEECSRDDINYHLNLLDLDFNDVGRKSTQPETRLVKHWFRSQRFLLGAMLHAGDELSVTYGFRDKEGGGTLYTPDEDVFSEISRSYTEKNRALRQGNRSCPTGRATNTVSSKRVSMPLQEYAYSLEGTLELVLTVSCCNLPAKLKPLWQENKKALLSLLLQANRGVRGYVKSVDGTLVQHALLTVNGRNAAFWTSDQGEFFRILPPGDYVAVVAAKRYLPAKLSFTVPKRNWSAPVVVNLVEAYIPVNVQPVPVKPPKMKPPAKKSEPPVADTAGTFSNTPENSIAACILLLGIWTGQLRL